MRYNDGNDTYYSTHWWRAVGPDGEVWCESSSESEVRSRARPGDKVQRLWTKTTIEHDWRDS